MKVNEANLQLYRIDQTRNVQNHQPVKPAEANQFLKARFADLLSENERAFIVQNFKPDTSPDTKKPKLGRFIDVRA